MKRSHRVLFSLGDGCGGPFNSFPSDGIRALAGLWPLPIGQMRRNKERLRLTEWNVGFYKHTTLERVRHDIGT